LSDHQFKGFAGLTGPKFVTKPMDIEGGEFDVGDDLVGL
jgi:hypothetical protein